MELLPPQTLYFSLLLLLLTYFAWKIISSCSNSLTTPPSPPRLPIIGHLHLLTDMPHHTFTRLCNKLGPLIYLQLGQVPTLVINSARLARLVLKTHDHIFANRPQLLSAQYLSFGCSDVTFSPYGAYWRQARKICVTELLSAKRVHSFQVVREEEVNRLLAAVLAESGKEVDMSKRCFALANDILCMVAFGQRFMEEEGKKQNLVNILTETQALFAGFCLGDFFPGWQWVNSVSGYKKRLMKNLDDLRAVCDEIIDEHMKRKNSGRENDDQREDFVDVLLRIQKRKDLEVPISDDNLKALVLDMFVAGTDTSAATLEWTLTELARHPRFMKKAQEEVRKIAIGKRTVDESHLQDLPYMKAVIKETMRLHPPVPLLVPRESMDKFVLDGYQIPFGGGRRGCPGYNFGLSTIEIALARLLYHFEWALPRGVGADDVDLSEIFGLATRKKTALVLVPTANKDYQFQGEAV